MALNFEEIFEHGTPERKFFDEYNKFVETTYRLNQQYIKNEYLKKYHQSTSTNRKNLMLTINLYDRITDSRETLTQLESLVDKILNHKKMLLQKLEEHAVKTAELQEYTNIIYDMFVLLTSTSDSPINISIEMAKKYGEYGWQWPFEHIFIEELADYIAEPSAEKCEYLKRIVSKLTNSAIRNPTTNSKNMVLYSDEIYVNSLEDAKKYREELLQHLSNMDILLVKVSVLYDELEKLCNHTLME